MSETTTPAEQIDEYHGHGGSYEIRDGRRVRVEPPQETPVAPEATPQPDEGAHDHGTA